MQPAAACSCLGAVGGLDWLEGAGARIDGANRTVPPYEDAAIKAAVWETIRAQAHAILRREPILQPLLQEAVLSHSSFIDALIHRLSAKLGGSIMTPEVFSRLFKECVSLEGSGQLERFAMEDLIAVEQKDPACKEVLQVMLHFKGYWAIQTYRMSHALWKMGRRDAAMAVQARCTEVFGVDIHPGARIGPGLMIDHGTGVVIGETAVVGSDCSFLHGVTLGNTGASTEFDRHPKIGDDVFLGCGTTVLGNVKIGSHCRIGACSLVLKELPAGATAVGSPAVIIRIDPRYTATPSTNAPGAATLSTAEASAKTRAAEEERRPSLRLWRGEWRKKSYTEGTPPVYLRPSEIFMDFGSLI